MRANFKLTANGGKTTPQIEGEWEEEKRFPARLKQNKLFCVKLYVERPMQL